MADQLRVVDELMLVVRTSDVGRTGTIRKEVMNRILRRLFHSKSWDDMLRLRFTLVAFTDANGAVNYPALFDEDSQGNQSRFVELIREQHLREVCEFTVDIEEALRATIQNGNINIGAARRAIKQQDPLQPTDEIDAIVAVGANSVSDRVMDTLEVPAEIFLTRIRTRKLLVRRSPLSVEENQAIDLQLDYGKGDLDVEIDAEHDTIADDCA